MTTDTLINALVKAQQEIDHIVQDAKNPFFKSDYATLKAVFDSVKKPLNDNNIYIQQVSHPCDDGVMVETIFYGHGGSMNTGRVHIPAAKTDPQAYGSALSYAKRYSLLMACGIATKNEDDDAEKAMQRTSKTVTKKEPTKPAIKYKLLGSESNKAPIATAMDEIGLLNACRRLMKDPNNDEHIALFQLNRKVIDEAMSNADDNDVYDSFSTLISLYEGE